MERLKSIELLQSLSEAALADVDRQCKWRQFRKGEVILERATANRDVFFVSAGEVQIVNFSLTGRPVAYANLYAGNYFGELAAIDGEPRSASAVAEAETLIGALDSHRFVELMENHTEVAMRVMRRLAHIVRVCDERIIDLATLGAMQRVVVELCRASKPDPVTPGSFLIYPCPTQRQFADRAATTRETVARVFAQLLDSKQIFRKGRTLYLRDRPALEQIAQRLKP